MINAAYVHDGENTDGGIDGLVVEIMLQRHTADRGVLGSPLGHVRIDP